MSHKKSSDKKKTQFQKNNDACKLKYNKSKLKISHCTTMFL